MTAATDRGMALEWDRLHQILVDAASGSSSSEEVARIEDALRPLGSPLRSLGARFELTGFERDTLLLALSVEASLDSARNVAALNAPRDSALVTVDLALRLFAPGGDHRRRGRTALGPDGKLFAEGLLEWAGPAFGSHLARPFRVTRVVLEHFLADVTSIPSGCRMLTDGETAPEAQGLAAALSADANPPITMVVGTIAAEPEVTALAVSSALSRPMLVVDLDEAEEAEVDPVAVRARARLERATVYLRHVWRSPARLRWVRRVSYGAPIFVETRPDDDWSWSTTRLAVTAIHCSEPDTRARGERWRAVLRESEVTIDDALIDEVATSFVLSREQVRLAVGHARVATAAERGLTDTLDAEALRAACRARLDHDLAAVATKCERRQTWDDLVLPDVTKRRLHDFVHALKHRSLVFETWALADRIGGTTGISALFTGASGTGKTMAASVVARSVGLDIYRIDLASVVSKYIGETEKNLDRAFGAARRASAILFFDEAEALLGKRSEVKDAHDRYSNIEVAYLLQRLEAHPGAVIFATNLAKNLDAAFARRMHFVVEFPRPDPKLRLAIWRSLLSDRVPVAADVDLSVLAERFETTGGEIRNVLLDAAFLAARGGRPISMSNLMVSMARHLRQEGRLPTASSFGAFHDAVAEALL